MCHEKERQSAMTEKKSELADDVKEVSKGWSEKKNEE